VIASHCILAGRDVVAIIWRALWRALCIVLLQVLLLRGTVHSADLVGLMLFLTRSPSDETLHLGLDHKGSTKDLDALVRSMLTSLPCTRHLLD